MENAVVKNGKLRAYYTFKPFFKKEIYLQFIRNRDVRKCFTQFRISAHQLAIERGKDRNIKIKDKICKYCQSSEVEDEIYFLINCQKFTNERKELFPKIEKFCKCFSSLTDDNKFLWLMTSEDAFVIEKLACHIFTCFGNNKISACSR